MAKQTIRGDSWWVSFDSFFIWMLLYGVLLYHWFHFPLWQAVISSFVLVTLLGAACIIMSRNAAYYRPAAGFNKFIYVIIVSFSLTFLWLCVGNWLLMTITIIDPVYLKWLDNAVPVQGIVGWILIAEVGFRGQLWYDAEEQRHNRQRKADAEKIVREAELFKLRQQLQPHFLFNSLNAINALITLHPKAAREMVLKLSDFLRGSLKREDDQLISLLEELQYLQLYLDIEKVRFGDRLTVDVVYDDVAGAMLMPPMLLQPVVENAIKFGLYDTIGKITISIRSWVAENILYITVQNPFDDQSEKQESGTGFGLSSIRRRLYLVFARQDLLETTTRENIYTTLIKVPQTHDKSNHN